jgi:L-2-hydroxyglutarate oxidase LhgO
MFKVEAVVIGAGIIGLAVARSLALRGVQVLLIEKESGPGTATSSRNSEVIHSGIYYEPDSLKAVLCVEGRRSLYRYSADRGVPYRQSGKLVVATSPDEDAYLDHLLARAQSNGVEGIERIGAARLNSLEPEIRGTSALLSPCTGIIDSHALMQSYQADLEAAGGTSVFRTKVVGAELAGDKIRLSTGGADADAAEVEADLVVNAAGLEAWDFSSRVDGLDSSTIPPRYLAKGSYFALAGVGARFRHLVYPVPEPGGLGIHLTLDLAGQARFGPDVEWVDTIDYAVDAKRSERFYSAIRRYWPSLPDGTLACAYCGIRPKTSATGPCDFVIQGPAHTGHRAYMALYGIESPGLTASLAIGEHVAELACA